MKKKLDFITNSSSTAFMVKAKNTGTVLKKMWDIYLKDLKEYWPDNELSEQQLEADKWINENYKTFNNNVIIPWTCNYETLIFHNDNSDISKKGYIEVNTCTNTNWWGSSKLDIIDIGDDWDYGTKFNLDEIQFKDLFDMKTKTYKEFLEQSENYEF